MTTPTTLATDRNNDLYLDEAGNIAIASGLDAVTLDCKAAMETRLGECVLDTTLGIPMFETVFLSYQPAQFQAAARKALVSVTGVTGVNAVNITRSGGVMRYVAEISTIFGVTAISNGAVA